MNIVVHTDGGARGNPGPSGIGVVIEKISPGPAGSSQTLAEFGKAIGVGTNNVAEYTAVIHALRWLGAHGKEYGLDSGSTIEFVLDSTLVVNQLNGLFKVKNAQLRNLLLAVRTLEAALPVAVHYTAVAREKNTRADALVNEALDRKNSLVM